MSLRIPFDVLVVIQSVADQATIGRMMQCCRYLKATGEWFILRDVQLSSNKVVEGFVRYMISSHVSRLPLLHGLRLEMTPPPTVPRDSLRELFIKLRTGSKLVRLSIHRPEELLQRHAGLSSAIAALTSLQHLELWNAGPITVGMLHAVRSKLVVATLHMGSGGANDLPDVTQLFRGSQNTLEELTVTRPGPTTSHPLGERNATTFALCYPRMRTLTLIEPTYSLYTADYIRAFPNLRSLAILDPNEYPLRDPNRPPSNTDPYKTWPSLRYVEGSVRVLYGLALPCHIPTIDVHDFDHVPQVDLLRVVLAETRPVHLKLSVLSAKRCKAVYVTALEQMELPHLRALSLTVVLMCEDTNLDLKLWLKGILRIPKTLMLSAFELHIDCSQLYSERRCLHSYLLDCPAERYPRPSLLPVERQLRAFSMRSVVKRVRERAPQVERVVARVSGHDGGTRSWAALGACVPWADI
ncbi:hypothetical protein OH76DRAFT_656813 [Lentinus brumalis]|uniref:F-box domain-containing protein n=1 Tax=Lentinus brumalis TaxID=2498619 RepID=A0A371D7I9_9APHY|nr:hypothetical protein OH76DRAFT_656813 [Polyporus brumalis]